MHTFSRSMYKELKQVKSTAGSKKSPKKKKKNPWDSSSESDTFHSDDSMPNVQELVPERKVARRSAGEL